jgi:DNA-directed RNA polymerase specialized sigma subunit
VDSLAEKIAEEIDEAYEEWLEKEAAAAGVDRAALQQFEMETWQRWSESPNKGDFETLYNSHQPLFQMVGRRYLNNTNLPVSAVKARMTQNYVDALETYDPSVSKLSTWVSNKLPHHIPRYLASYSNVGRIPEDRGGLISLYQEREPVLREQLGRNPTANELADDMNVTLSDLGKKQVRIKDIGTIRKEIRPDFVAEEAGGETVDLGPSKKERMAVYLHGSLNPEQQLVLEHTYSGFGKEVTDDVEQLSSMTNMSPQKIRSLKKQIFKKLERYD